VRVDEYSLSRGSERADEEDVSGLWSKSKRNGQEQKGPAHRLF
jgi:hypothetical protein